MINLQPMFNEFNEKIKLSYSENAELCEKRDIIINKLKENLTKKYQSFKPFNQGSYAMHTGIKPDNSDYDIDVGLRFELANKDHIDPVTVKQLVYNALDGHTKKVELRRSCVTVTYQKNYESSYHVDLACYAVDNGKLYIAKGKTKSTEACRCWELSDPLGLIDKMQNRWSEQEDREQFLRIIRYIKKWKSKHFVSSGNSAPTGIALTALAYEKFMPRYQYNQKNGKYMHDDFSSLKAFTEAITSSFKLRHNDDGNYYHVIEQKLFVSPSNNLFEKSTMKQQDEFYDKISTMLFKLNKVEKSTDKTEACSILTDLFGDDFPCR